MEGVKPQARRSRADRTRTDNTASERHDLRTKYVREEPKLGGQSRADEPQQ